MGESWTVLKVLRWTTDYLLSKEVSNPRLDAELLIGDALHKDRVGLYLCFDQPLQAAELALIKALVARRARREPLQYILGHSEFWSLPFKVEPGILIPRGDTEIVVEEALRIIAASSAPNNGAILDIGCGSGAIAIAIAHTLAKDDNSTARVDGIDISAQAVQLAQHNAQQNEVANLVHFYHHDMAELEKFIATTGGEKYQLLVSNPPYISTAEMADLMPEVKDHEPHLALEAGSDGLDCYRLLCDQARHCLQPQGWLVVEVGSTQAEEVKALMAQAGLQQIFQRNDYSGITRVVGGQFAPNAAEDAPSMSTTCPNSEA